MDAFTLFVSVVLASVLMAGGMGLLYLTGARLASLRDWSLAALFFACGGVLSLSTGRTYFDVGLAPALASACQVAGHVGILAGVRRLFGLGPRWKLLVIPAALTLAAQAVLQGAESPGEQLWLTAPALVAIDLCLAWTLARHARAESRAACMPLFVLALLSAFFTCERLAVLASNCTPSAAAGALYALVFVNAAALGCTLIASHWQEQGLRRAALSDALTGWLNRRALGDIGWRTFRRCTGARTPAYFIIFDIDHFRTINERFGHSVGDAAIRHVAGLATGVARGRDDLFRIGGAEFAVLLTDATPTEVSRIAERLRALVAESPLETHGEQVPMTVSVGVAALQPGDIQWEDILRRADQALGYAKLQGRNRVSALGLEVREAGAMLDWGMTGS